MRILFLGDIVGEPGRKIVRDGLAAIKAKYRIDLVIANAENAAGGSGINPRCYTQLANAGVQAFTMGDHVYRKKEIFQLFDAGYPICKPANFPPDAPGPDHIVVTTDDEQPVAVISLLGRVFMRPVDCPFRAVDRVLDQLSAEVSIVVVDMHAEATSDKQLMARYLAGRVTAVLGTHTHVPTADATILEPGTAFITDVGMTGPYDSVIGRRYDRVMKTTFSFEPTPFDVAQGDPRISGALIDVDPETGLATSISLLHLDRRAIEAMQAATTTPVST